MTHSIHTRRSSDRKPLSLTQTRTSTTTPSHECNADEATCGGATGTPTIHATGRHATARPGHPQSGRPGRSEEHTSELQSLMRLSYAVFCLTNTLFIFFSPHLLLFFFFLLSS